MLLPRDNHLLLLAISSCIYIQKPHCWTHLTAISCLFVYLILHMICWLPTIKYWDLSPFTHPQPSAIHKRCPSAHPANRDFWLNPYIVYLSIRTVFTVHSQTRSILQGVSYGYIFFFNMFLFFMKWIIFKFISFSPPPPILLWGINQHIIKCILSSPINDF